MSACMRAQMLLAILHPVHSARTPEPSLQATQRAASELLHLPPFNRASPLASQGLCSRDAPHVCFPNESPMRSDAVPRSWRQTRRCCMHQKCGLLRMQFKLLVPLSLLIVLRGAIAEHQGCCSACSSHSHCQADRAIRPPACHPARSS